MLAVQVQYWDLEERKRHNLVTERQGDRNLNIAEGELAVHQGQLEELKRHNLVTENYSLLNLGELSRHNRATEDISRESNSINAYNAESNRLNALANQMNAATNAAMVDVSWYNAETSRRSQTAQAHYNNAQIGVANRNAAATERHNEILATQTSNSYELGSRQAAVAETNAQTNYMNLMEVTRHNQIQESQNAQQININQQHINIERDKLTNQIVQDTWRNLNESYKITTK